MLKRIALAVSLFILGSAASAGGFWVYQRYQEFVVMREVAALLLPEAQARARQLLQQAQQQPSQPQE